MSINKKIPRFCAKLLNFVGKFYWQQKLFFRNHLVLNVFTLKNYGLQIIMLTQIIYSKWKLRSFNARSVPRGPKRQHLWSPALSHIWLSQTVFYYFLYPKKITQKDYDIVWMPIGHENLFFLLIEIQKYAPLSNMNTSASAFTHHFYDSLNASGHPCGQTTKFFLWNFKLIFDHRNPETRRRK